MAPCGILSLTTTTALLLRSTQPPFRALIPNSTFLGSSPIPLSSCGGRVRIGVSRADGNRGENGFFEDFSVLPKEDEWEGVEIWSTFGVYLFSLHIPLSFGGLAVVSSILHQPELDPLTEVVVMFMLITLESVVTLSLLSYTAKSEFGVFSIFQDQSVTKKRGWIIASAVGFGSLVFFVLLTSLLADHLTGTMDVNDHPLQKFVTGSPATKAICFSSYCFIIPLLEETVYRRFLLRSLASTMNWQQAIIISSVLFSISHFSLENSLQLFLIGSVLGSVYCWSGNIISSIVVHSLYNAAILLLISS